MSSRPRGDVIVGEQTDAHSLLPNQARSLPSAGVREALWQSPVHFGEPRGGGPWQGAPPAGWPTDRPPGGPVQDGSTSHDTALYNPSLGIPQSAPYSSELSPGGWEGMPTTFPGLLSVSPHPPSVGRKIQGAEVSAWLCGQLVLGWATQRRSRFPTVAKHVGSNVCSRVALPSGGAQIR